jgi:DNA sulfur modification protein DndC
VPTELVVRLLDVERAAHGLKRRHAVHTKIEDLFRQEWRGIDVVVAERRGGPRGQVENVADPYEEDPELTLLAVKGEEA